MRLLFENDWLCAVALVLCLLEDALVAVRNLQVITEANGSRGQVLAGLKTNNEKGHRGKTPEEKQLAKVLLHALRRKYIHTVVN